MSCENILLLNAIIFFLRYVHLFVHLNLQMCLINVAHEHFVTEAGKKSKPALENFMGRGSGGLRANIWGIGPTAEKNKYPPPQASKLKIKVITRWWNWYFALQHSLQYYILSQINPVILPILYTYQLLYIYNWVAHPIYKNQNRLCRPMWKRILRSVS